MVIPESLSVPLTNIYSPSVLGEWIGPLEVGLSWAVIILVGGDIHNGAPLFIVALVIIIKTVLKNRGFSLPSKKIRENHDDIQLLPNQKV